jgi:hypothetical protein
MKSSITALLLVVGFCAAAPAVEKPYQTGQIVDVQRKVETRILYYVVNTPITEDDPYYEVSVQLGNTVYRGLHIPRHPQDTLPEAWKPGNEVQARIEGRHFYLKPSDGVEVDFTIAKRIAAAPPVAK